jgi:hypothetical protein
MSIGEYVSRRHGDMGPYFTRRRGDRGRTFTLRSLFCSNSSRLEHDPEKWKPVFGKDHAQTKDLDLDPISLDWIEVGTLGDCNVEPKR